MLVEQENFGEITNRKFWLSDTEQKSLVSFFCSLESKLTQKEYHRACGDFFDFVAPDISGLQELTRNHLILYQKALRTKNQSKLTILKKISAVASMCKHLAHDGFIAKDLSYGLKRPKAEVAKKTADLSDEQVKCVFDSLEPSRVSFTSHRAMLSLGFYTGLRSSEIRHLKIKNLAELDGHRILALTVKGDNKHEVPLAPFVRNCLVEHLNYLEKIGVDVSDSSQWIFPGLRPFKNKPVSATALNNAFQKALQNAQIPTSSVRRYSPHSMRATFAGHLLNTQKVALEEVQRTRGHSSPTTTQKYNKRKSDLNENPVYKVNY